jgi:hypothetical protein
MRRDITKGREGDFAIVHTRVTLAFKKRLQYACMQREREYARCVTEGEVLMDLGRYLDPHPDELGTANGARPERKQPKQDAPKRAQRTASQG